MTPNSGMYRKYSADFNMPVNSNMSVHSNMSFQSNVSTQSNQAVAHVMATPPYSADYWASKKEQLFFDTPSAPKAPEPTFDELRGIPKSITVETAGKVNQKTVYTFPQCNCLPGKY